MHGRECKHRVLCSEQKVRTRGLTDKIITYCYQQNTSFNEQQAPHTSCRMTTTEVS